MYTWDDLKAYWAQGEAWIEGNLEHEAILVARWLDAQRRKALVAEDAPADPAPADPAA